MFHHKVISSATAAFLLCGTSAFALTTEQVWADWQASASKGAASVSAATEARDGTTLRLNGVKMAANDGSGEVMISEVVLTEEADGSVAIRPGDISVTLAPDAGSMSVTHDGLVISVHEDAGGRGYGVGAAALGVAFDVKSASAGGAAGAPAQNTGLVDFGGFAARYAHLATGVSVDLSADRLAYSISQVDSAAGLDSDSTSETQNLRLTGGLTIPDGVTLTAINGPQEFWAAVQQGLAFDWTMTQGLSKGSIDDRNPMFPMKATFEVQSGSSKALADASRLRVETSAPGLSLQVTPAGAPDAIPVTMNALGMTFEMPVTAPDGGAFELGLRLGNLVLGEGAWAMFDPAGALPRDPADLSLLLTGTAKLDLPAITIAESGGAVPPVPEPLTLDIRELAIKAAGAALSGTGAFTFDNSALAMGGPPMPVGTANLRLEGGNKLIDALIASGLLAEQDAMGARMMMTMFGKPEGDDILTSQIEAKEGGSIFVNGQQIQ
jgi:hypothetical protein